MAKAPAFAIRLFLRDVQRKSLQAEISQALTVLPTTAYRCNPIVDAGYFFYSDNASWWSCLQALINLSHAEEDHHGDLRDFSDRCKPYTRNSRSQGTR